MIYTPNPMPFCGSRLDFMELERSPEQVQSYLDNPKARALLFVSGRPA